ncbi:MAG: V-type ATP synthase subunit E [Lachnospiraceae bacterium]|nr:V-type ATP synthase subunit E [Lachnospiraceae bacterium]
MKGLEKITARIEADARRDAEAVLETARAEAEQVRAAGDAAAKERYEALMREGKQAAADRLARLSRAAEMEEKKALLSCRQLLVEEAFERAAGRIKTLPHDAYVRHLATQALRASVTGKEEILLNEADKNVCGQEVLELANRLLAEAGKKAELTLSEETGRFSGGIVLKEGSVFASCTNEVLMDQARESLSAAVAAGLFQ